jgi:hypothetical protein
MAEYLAIVDADRIHDYVFSPRQLKLIRGASTVQANLNEELVPTLRSKGGKPIYAGGGTVLGRFPNEDNARSFARLAEAQYIERTWTATATSAVGELGEDFRLSMERLKESLERRKTGRSEHGFNVGSPYWKVCQACGQHPAYIGVADDEFLCQPCKIRLDNSERGLHLEEIEERTGKALRPPKDFSDIGSRSKPDNYMALIYLDVNRLGEHLHDRRSESADAYQEASKAVQGRLRKVWFRAAPRSGHERATGLPHLRSCCSEGTTP